MFPIFAEILVTAWMLLIIQVSISVCHTLYTSHHFIAAVIMLIGLASQCAVS